MPLPIVGILAGCRIRNEKEELHLYAEYFDAVEKAGGAPIVLPHVRERKTLTELLSRLDALVISGGPDVPPQRYGEANHEANEIVHPRRDEFDFRCLAMALEMRLPILAICYGCQMLNVHFGGTLVQDIPSHMQISEEHRQQAGRRVFHRAQVEPGTMLAGIVGAAEMEVNSSHHQALGRIGAGLRVCARSPEGVIEAVESSDGRFILGVQWHPEEIVDRPEQMSIFTALIHAAEQGADFAFAYGRMVHGGKSRRPPAASRNPCE